MGDHNSSKLPLIPERYITSVGYMHPGMMYHYIDRVTRTNQIHFIISITKSDPHIVECPAHNDDTLVFEELYYDITEMIMFLNVNTTPSQQQQQSRYAVYTNTVELSDPIFYTRIIHNDGQLHLTG